MIDLIKVLVPVILTFILGLLAHFREMKKKSQTIKILKKESKHNDIKVNLFNKIINLESINNIKRSVDRMFENSNGDRFLILIAINGKEDFNKISVIFEQHKNNDYAINASARYKHVSIDDTYRKVLKDLEKNGREGCNLNVSTMENSLLKRFYSIENVKHSKMKFILRSKIDKDNDILIYSSITTHKDTPFTETENTYINLEYENTITPNLKEVLN